MKLTLEDIQCKEACSPQTQLFMDTFGNEMELTKEEGLHAIDVGLDTDWYVIHIMTPSQRREYRHRLYPIKTTYNNKLAELAKEEHNEEMSVLHYNFKKDKVLLIHEILAGAS